jgi:hypothetical protein
MQGSRSCQGGLRLSQLPRSQARKLDYRALDHQRGERRKCKQNIPVHPRRWEDCCPTLPPTAQSLLCKCAEPVPETERRRADPKGCEPWKQGSSGLLATLRGTACPGKGTSPTLCHEYPRVETGLSIHNCPDAAKASEKDWQDLVSEK